MCLFVCLFVIAIHQGFPCITLNMVITALGKHPHLDVYQAALFGFQHDRSLPLKFPGCEPAASLDFPCMLPQLSVTLSTNRILKLWFARTSADPTDSSAISDPLGLPFFSSVNHHGSKQTCKFCKGSKNNSTLVNRRNRDIAVIEQLYAFLCTQFLHHA